MNAYDFDETVYYGDSEFHFIEYIFAKYPSMKKYARRYKFYRFLQKKLKLISRDAARVKIFAFLKVLDNVDKELSEFWATHEKNLKKVSRRKNDRRRYRFGNSRFYSRTDRGKTRR